MYHELYKNISNAVGVLTVFDNEGTNISQGSCFCINDVGQVLTAAHVVTSRFPINQKDLEEPGIKYLISFPGIPVIEYTVRFCAVTIHVEAFRTPIQVDIAMLQPKFDNQVEYPIMPVCTDSPRLGEEVFMAGYSDELELPFVVDRILDKASPGVGDFFKAMQEGYTSDLLGPMIKRAVVGNHRVTGTSVSGLNVDLICDFIYLDNGIHSGASGGPVVNKSGQAVGIITQRALTSASQSDSPSLNVPSGSTVAISLTPLLAIEEIENNKVGLK